MSCKDCFRGTIHAGPLSGSVQTLHNLPTYISNAPATTTPKGIIVIIPDVFGWEMPNARLVADQYASAGYKVLLPDFMDGGAIAAPIMDTMETALDSTNGILTRAPAFLSLAMAAVPFLIYNRAAVASPKIYDYFRAVREENKDMKVAAAGFCWGGKYTTLLCSGQEKTADGRPLVDCGYTAHPSSLVLPTDIELVTLPLSIANGTEDIQLTKEKMEQMRPILERKSKEGVDCELVIYEEAKHGFAIRAKKDDEREERQMVEAIEQAVRFFDKHTEGEKHGDGGRGSSHERLAQ